ncbi:hypothetical protein HYQ46_003496 [Verticillium longisporum]|nr:hypothetical protein HYQ46_003496 [Verticillium longisporum]
MGLRGVFRTDRQVNRVLESLEASVETQIGEERGQDGVAASSILCVFASVKKGHPAKVWLEFSAPPKCG